MRAGLISRRLGITAADLQMQFMQSNGSHATRLFAAPLLQFR